MKIRIVGMFLLAVFAARISLSSSDCLEPDTRVVGRWKNGNYYKGLVESLTNSLNVLFDNGNRLSYNLHSKYDVLEDRIPEQNEIKWGDPVVVHRPHSFAFQPAHIREVIGGRYMVWYKDGSYIYQTKNDIRVFNKSTVCNEPAYLGCFRDQVPRYLTVFIPTRPATVATCVDMCNAQGYSVAALRNSDLCFCGNAYNKGYQTNDRRCDMPCYDNPYEKCGGIDTFSQYWTGIVGDKPIYRPSGIQAYTKFHMDPYGFKQTYQSVIRKQFIPKFGKLPWKNILQARRAVKRPSSLSQSSPWRWNALTSSWSRADGKQFRWIHTLPRMPFKRKNYRTWGSSKAPITRNGWTWNGRAWVPASKMSTGFRRMPQPYSKTTSPFPKSTYGKAASKPAINHLQATVKPVVTRFQSYNPWKPPSTNTLRSFNNVDISKEFTPNLVLQKLADRMRTVKWSQLSNFEQAFKPSSSVPLTFRYLGCFADDYQRDLPFQYSMPANSLSVRSCILKCREHGFSVAGLQGSTQCFCGNTYSKYGRVREEECMMRCSSSAIEFCGGVLRNSIYFTGIGSAWPANLSKPKTTQNTSTHAHNTTNDKPAKKVTSAKHHKFGKATTWSTSKVKKTSSFTEIKNKKPQRTKNKARNKIDNVPKEIPEKDNSGIEDFQVESIKVKVNFSELKKALQTLSPEIVRRVQKDLSRIHKKEHYNHPREKVKVELEEAKQDNKEEYSENDVKRIRNEIHNKALDRLSNDNIKEILRIMKIPKFELSDEHRSNDFEDAIKSIQAATKKGNERNGIKVVDGKDVAHEEIESYSRISLDIPLRHTRNSSTTSRKEASEERRRNRYKIKLKGKTNNKSLKDKSTTINAMGHVYNEKAQPIKKYDKAERTNNNNLKNVTHSDYQNHGQLKAKINDKSTSENKPIVDDGIKKMKSKDGAMKVDVHSDAQAMKGTNQDIEKVYSDKKQRSKGQAVSKSIDISKPNIHISSASKSPSLENAASLPKLKGNQNKELDSGVSQVQIRKSMNETAQSSVTREDESGGDKQNTIRLSANGDEKVRKNQNQSKLGDNGVMYLDDAAKMNDDSRQEKGQRSQTNTSDKKENLQMDFEKEGDENGVIYLGAAAKQLDKIRKHEEANEDRNVPISKEGVTLDEGKKAGTTPGVIKKDDKKQEEKVKTKEKQDSKEKEKKVTLNEKVGKEHTANIPKKKEKKKDKKVEKLMKSSHDAKIKDKKGKTEATKDTATNFKAINKERKAVRHNHSSKSHYESKDNKTSHEQMLPKEIEHQRKSRKKVNNVNSDTIADLKTEKDSATKNDKLRVSQSSLQMKIQNQHAGSDSIPTTTNNIVHNTDGGSGDDGRSLNLVSTQTPFEQESKLISFQKQNSIDGKSSNATFRNNSRKSGERKGENVNGLDYSGISEADRATETKIISKLNRLLNSGSGDDNFEDVVRELEKNKIDGISTNGITIKTAEEPGSNSNQERNVNRLQYKSNSDKKDAKKPQPEKKVTDIGVRPIGEDLEGNDETLTPTSHDQKPIHLPSKDLRVDNDENTASGFGSASSGERSNRYTYFGSGVDKEELPLIRADDLERLKQGQRNNPFESSGDETGRKSTVRGESFGEEGQSQDPSKTVNHKILDARSSIPTPPRYKMILIRKENLTPKKKKSKGKFDGKSRILKLVLGKKALSAKTTAKKNKQKNTRKNVPKKSTLPDDKGRSDKRKRTRKGSSKEKHYSEVRGVRVVKNGVAFTVSKGQSSTSRSSGPLNTNNPSVNRAETTNTDRAINTKLKMHHISERRRKIPKRMAKVVKTAKSNVGGSEDETLDDAEHNLKDNGSRNQLIWRASRSNEINNKNLED